MSIDRDIEQARSAQSWRKPVLIAMIAAVLFGSYLAWGWWSSPSVLGDRTGGGMYATRNLTQSSPVYFGITTPGSGVEEETITFRSAPKAHFADNSANATAEFLICVRAEGVESGIGAGDDEMVATYCGDVRPIRDGTKLHWGNDEPIRESILLRIKPTFIGTARVDRVTYDYSRGRGFHQRGKDEADAEVTVKVPR